MNGAFPALASLRIDEDDLAFDLLPELERSFGVSLERDLRHVVTVGDLHALMCAARDHGSCSGEGFGCASQMAYYRLRTTLCRYGLDRRARPGDALDSIRLPAPRRFKAMFEQETGLVLPTPVIGWRSLVGCLAFTGVVPILAVFGWMAWSGWAGLAGIVMAVAVLRTDQGKWIGGYGSLRALATATAALNHRAFVSAGARNGEGEVWRVIIDRLAVFGVQIDRIGPETRLSV